MAQPNLKITFEIEPIVKLQCACSACQFNIASGDHIMTRNETVQPEGFCLLKHVVIDEDGKCADKSVVQTEREKCEAFNLRGHCILPRNHKGNHLNVDGVEFWREGNENGDYYASRQYTCRDGEERCKAAASVNEVGVYKRCTLPADHQGPHLTADDVEF